MSQLKTPLAFRRKSVIRNKGFTLIEVLIVIVLIAALAVLVLYMTRRARNAALQATAMSTLRQVAAASAAYSVDKNGDINVLRDKGDPQEGNNTPQPGGDAWVSNTFWGRLQPFLFTDSTATNQSQLGKELKLSLATLFSSTDIDKMKGTAFANSLNCYHDSSGLPVPFAFNTNPLIYQYGDKPVKPRTSAIDNLANTLYMSYGWYHFPYQADIPYTEMKAQFGKGGIYFLENRNALGSFLDGHIEPMQAPILERRLK